MTARRHKRFIRLFMVLLIGSVTLGCTAGDGDKGADRTPPTAPNGISITAVSLSEVKVAWKPSADDRGVKEYKIYRNGAYLKATGETAMTDKGLTLKTKYCYRVSACDKAGNESALSTDVCAIP